MQVSTDAHDVFLAQANHGVLQLASMHSVAGSQSCGHDVAVSPALQVPLLQPLGGQSKGQLIVVSLGAQVRSPQMAAAGQSLGQVALLSPVSQVPLPHSGPIATHW